MGANKKSPRVFARTLAVAGPSPSETEFRGRAANCARHARVRPSAASRVAPPATAPGTSFVPTAPWFGSKWHVMISSADQCNSLGLGGGENREAFGVSMAVHLSPTLPICRSQQLVHMKKPKLPASCSKCRRCCLSSAATG